MPDETMTPSEHCRLALAYAQAKYAQDRTEKNHEEVLRALRALADIVVRGEQVSR